MKTKTIEINGCEFTLSEATLYIDFKRQELLDDAYKENETDKDVSRKLMRIGYVNLTAGVTGGTPPSFDDLMYKITATETKVWSDAARVINPQWFPDLAKTQEEQVDEAKKKPN